MLLFTRLPPRAQVQYLVSPLVFDKCFPRDKVRKEIIIKDFNTIVIMPSSITSMHDGQVSDDEVDEVRFNKFASEQQKKEEKDYLRQNALTRQSSQRIGSKTREGRKWRRMKSLLSTWPTLRQRGTILSLSTFMIITSKRRDSRGIKP